MSTGLVLGYDFLIDQANKIEELLTDSGLTVDALINDSWVAADMSALWLDTYHDLASINGHFNHFEAVPADEIGGVVTAQDLLAALVNRSGVVDST